MEYPEYLQPVLKRFVGNFPATIDCGKGWWPLIRAIDDEINKLDPNYSVYQIKEKFGGLRFYYAPSDPKNSSIITAIISKYESLSYKTCEVTGEEGFLMIRNGHLYKTLNASFAEQDGWEIVESF